MEMSQGTPTAREAARLIDDVSRAVGRGTRLLAAAVGAGLIRAGRALAQWGRPRASRPCTHG